MGSGASCPRPAAGAVGSIHGTALTAAPQFLGDLGKHIDSARTSSLRLVSWVDRGQSAKGQVQLLLSIERMQRLGSNAEPSGVTSDLVQRYQSLVDVKSRVLHSLGHDGCGDLLEFPGKSLPSGPIGLNANVGRIADNHIVNETKHTAAHERVFDSWLIRTADST